MTKIYPSFRYHPDGRSVIVYDEEEDRKLVGWGESPADFTDDEKITASQTVPLTEHTAVLDLHKELTEAHEVLKKDYAEFFQKVKDCKAFKDIKDIIDEYETE